MTVVELRARLAARHCTTVTKPSLTNAQHHVDIRMRAERAAEALQSLRGGTHACESKELNTTDDLQHWHYLIMCDVLTSTIRR